MRNDELTHIEGAAALERQHHDTTERIDARVRDTLTTKTFWAGVFVCSLLSTCFGGAWVYYLGPSIGVVGVEGESYARLAEINARLNSENEREAEENARLNAENEREAQENTRLNSENERLFRKNQEHSESREAMMGFLLNSPNRLERATRTNTLRPNGFPFSDWHPSLVENSISLCLRAGHHEALKWVTEQPSWESILSGDTANAVRAAVAAKNNMVAEISDKQGAGGE